MAGPSEAASVEISRGGEYPISGVLLAAGAALRFGGELPKQVRTFAGEALVRRAARALLGSRLCELVVVTGCCADLVSEALFGLDVRLVNNPRHAEGQSTSVRAGLAMVSPASEGACFSPCDQPFLDSQTIDHLYQCHVLSDRGITLPVFAGRRGTPVFFRRSMFSALMEIRGDQGGRQIVRSYPDEVLEVELPNERALLDADTSEELKRLEDLL